MELTTARLLLRPWQLEDAEALFQYAKDERIGPIAGWLPHISVENSREIIRTVLSAPETYAVVLKETNKPVGSVGIMFSGQCSTPVREQEAEIGYWIGVPYWGQGLFPKRYRPYLRVVLQSWAVAVFGVVTMTVTRNPWRVQEKCGFQHHHTEQDKLSPLGDYRTEHFTYLDKKAWQDKRRER